jgi:hypothetical protein
MEDLEKIKDRISKLLAMADDASSPEEAAIAAERARKLMDKYQLERFDVEGRVSEEFASMAASRAFAAVPQYMAFLATSVARYNDCQAFFSFDEVTFKKKNAAFKKFGKVISFRGYKSDVELAHQMFTKLMSVVDGLCKVYLKDKGYTKYPVRIGGQFKLGAIMVIGNRINEMVKERDAITSSSGNALVVIKKTAVDEHFGKCEPKYVSVKRADRDEAEADARRAGYVEGSKVEIVGSLESEEEGESPSSLRLSA